MNITMIYLHISDDTMLTIAFQSQIILQGMVTHSIKALNMTQFSRILLSLGEQITKSVVRLYSVGGIH